MDAVQGSLEQLVTFGLDDHYYETYAQRVRALTIPDAAGARRKRFVPITWCGWSWATGRRSRLGFGS